MSHFPIFVTQLPISINGKLKKKKWKMTHFGQFLVHSENMYYSFVVLKPESQGLSYKLLTHSIY